MKNPFMTSLAAKGSKVWETLSLKEEKNTLHLRLRREFKVTNEPSFHLGTIRPWIAGFIDPKTKKKVWSNTMTMVLDSCKPGVDRTVKKWTEKEEFMA